MQASKEDLEETVCRYLAERHPSGVSSEEIREITGQRPNRILKLHRKLIKKGLCKRSTEHQPCDFEATDLLIQQYNSIKDTSSSDEDSDERPTHDSDDRNRTAPTGSCLPPPMTRPTLALQKKQTTDVRRPRTMLQAPPETMIQQKPQWIIPKRQPSSQTTPQSIQPIQSSHFIPVASRPSIPSSRPVHRSNVMSSRQLYNGGQSWVTPPYSAYSEGNVVQRGWHQPTTIGTVERRHTVGQQTYRVQPRQGRYVLPLVAVRKNRQHVPQPPHPSRFSNVPMEKGKELDGRVEAEDFPAGLWNVILHESRSLRAASDNRGKSGKISEKPSELREENGQHCSSNPSTMFPHSFGGSDVSETRTNEATSESLRPVPEGWTD